jgi:hypothetical protein
MVYSILLASGVILLAISLFKFGESLAFIRKSERAIGTVIELEEREDGEGNRSYKPIFKFKTSANQEITCLSPVSSSPPAWKIGEEAIIAYNPANPSQAKVLTYFGAFLWTIVFMAIAMPLIVVGGGYFVAQILLKA